MTALTLGAAHLFSDRNRLSLKLASRIAAAAALSGVFVFFTAEYSRLRSELVHAARQLNLASHGHLATTHLGRAVLRDTVEAGLFSSVCSFFGAFLPLAIGAAIPSPSWLPLVVALSALGGLGLAISRLVCGSWPAWTLALVIAGGALTLIGVKLQVA